MDALIFIGAAILAALRLKRGRPALIESPDPAPADPTPEPGIDWGDARLEVSGVCVDGAGDPVIDCEDEWPDWDAPADDWGEVDQ